MCSYLRNHCTDKACEHMQSYTWQDTNVAPSGYNKRSFLGHEQYRVWDDERARAILTEDTGTYRNTMMPSHLIDTTQIEQEISRARYFEWTRRASTNMIGLVSPLASSFARVAISTDTCATSSRGRSTTSASINSTSLIYPQIDLPAPNPPQCRRISSPQLLSGEHNAAARCRARAKTERRTTRRYQRLRSTGSVESQRPRDVLDAIRSIRDGDTKSGYMDEYIEYDCAISPTLEPTPRDATCKGVQRESVSTDFPKKTQVERKQTNIPFNGALCLNTNPSQGRPPKLTALARCTTSPIPTLTVDLTNVSRDEEDISDRRVSPSYYLWHLLVEGTAPFVFSSVTDWRHLSGKPRIV